jgi:hypothetical protein
MALLAGLVLSGCSEPPPRSVLEYVEDPVLMEATLLRCRLEPELRPDPISCDNARRAAQRLASAAEAERRAQLEAESERRRAERRAREEAESEAARRAEEARRQAEEAAYEGRWEPLPSAPDDAGDGAADAPLPRLEPAPASPPELAPREAGRTPVEEGAAATQPEPEGLD